MTGGFVDLGYLIIFLTTLLQYFSIVGKLAQVLTFADWECWEKNIPEMLFLEYITL